MRTVQTKDNAGPQSKAVRKSGSKASPVSQNDSVGTRAQVSEGPVEMEPPPLLSRYRGVLRNPLEIR